MRISVANSDRSFSVTPGQPLLDAALLTGLNLPHSCRGGQCGACRARLVNGEVRYPRGRPLGLSELEACDGFILLCQAHALGDLTIDVVELSSPENVVIKRVPSRIERTTALSHDVLAVFLRVPAVETFLFEPGQYVDVMLSGGRRRSFSIASPPHDSRLLELHVRRVRGGEWTEPLFADPARTSLLAIEGPLGSFTYRAEGRAPLLMVGGGTGVAPLNSILRHVIENNLQRDIFLYWGVRSERDLYAHQTFERLARSVPKLRYTAVLSQPGGDWAGRCGFVHDAVLQDFASLDAFDIYASGPPAMIAAVRQTFALRGARLDRLFADSFDYASDTLERQRLSAVTKS